MRRKPWLGVAAVAILLAVLAGVGYAVSRSRTAPPDLATNSAKSPAPPVVVAPPLKTPPESIVKKAADASGIAAKAAPPKPLVSHEDSLKIAQAIQKKIEAAKARDSIAKAKIAEDTRRKMMDSIIAANSGSPAASPSGPRRLVIAEPPDQRGWPEASLLGRAVADSLRRMLRPRKQYAVVDQDSVREILLRTRGVTEVTKSLNSDLLVSVNLIPTRNDSATLILQVYDLTAVNQFRQRSSNSKVVAKNEVLSQLDAILLSTLTYLDEMTRAPRRPTPPAGPPGNPPPL